ncbi:MAG: ABC transporter ATP-binding protein [Clostridiales bacterium]|nr:ABC transporter ATP-binding protein [Clostridiales bacterium]
MAKNNGIPTPKGKSYEKPTATSSSILKRLWKYLMRHRMLIAFAVLLSIAANLLALIGPKLSGYALDAINPGAGKVDFPTILYYASLMIVFYFLSSILNYFLRALMIRISRNVVTNMRQDVYDHMMSLPVSFFDRIGTGQLLSVLSYDIDTINSSLSNDLVQILASLITVIGSFLMMMTISPPLVLIFVFTIPISIIITKSRSVKARKLYRDRSANLGELNSFSEEMMGGLKTIKAYHTQDVFCERFDQANVDACQANYAADAFSAATGPIINFINNLSLALISIFGAILYMNGSVSLGDVSSFVLYSRKFSGPINEFSNIISELQSALAAAERVFRLLDEPSEPADDASAIQFPKEKVIGQVDIKDVSFGYIENQTVLSGFNLSVKSGQTVAIVGPTGTGKTTLINLLMRFYDINEGQILIDGQDIRTYIRGDLRKAFAMVLQDTWLFSGTIYDNIAYGNENVTRDQVIAVAKAAKINRFIQSLPQGYETLLDDCGTNISKGQKQLLTIARAMLLDAPMLILDEATSNVDTQTERSIQAAMLRLMQGRTCFVIAHRLSTIRDADLIAVMQNGRIVESGTHSELMKSEGVYFELYKAQFDRVDQLAYA